MSDWGLVLPPSRPGESILRLIEAFIVERPHVTEACVLGATPEYRDILARAGIHGTIVDRSPDFFGYATQLCAQPRVETVIYADWLTELPRHAGRFDLILSHLTHGNVPFDRKSQFFEAVRNALRPGGIFIDYVLNLQGDGYDVESVTRLFSRRPINLLVANDFNCQAIFQSSHIRDLGVVDTSAIHGLYDGEAVDPCVRTLDTLANKITPRGMTWYYAFDRPENQFGYYDGYRILMSWPEPQTSPYYGVATLQFLSKQ